MKALVKNFRTVTEATIDIAPIALLCGLNGAGKTSMARAVAAAATGKAVPYAKVTKKDCKVLLRHGTHAGSVVLGGDEGTTTVEWPAGDVRSNGVVPHASDIAAGLTDLFSMKEADALAYLIDRLKASPTFEDLRKALEGDDIPPKTAESVWAVIEAQGWDAAHKRAVESGQQLKGAWSQITGVNFGTKKLEEWYPDGWEDAMKTETPEQVQVSVDAARKELEIAIGKNAVSKAEREGMEKIASERAIHEAKSIEKTAELEAKTKELEAIRAELGVTPDPNAKDKLKCPHCEKPVALSAVQAGAYTLTKIEPMDAKVAKEMALKHAALCGAHAKASGERNALLQEVGACTRSLGNAVEAEKKLAKMGDAHTGGDDKQVEAARTILSHAELHLSIVKRYNESRSLSKRILANQRIIDALVETGLRKQKLSQCIDAFISTYIEPLCEDFHIPLVSIDADLNVDLGTTTYQMLSESEQWRVRIVMQLALAKLEGSALVIIDRADILDRDSRAALMEMIINSGMPALICMTMNEPTAAPDLYKAGCGRTYWIDKGLVRPIGGERAAA